MSPAFACDEGLVRRLPLPLAQLYRRAHNAKTPLERHLNGFYLGEAALKPLAAVTVLGRVSSTGGIIRCPFRLPPVLSKRTGPAHALPPLSPGPSALTRSRST
jgi:hypothetical protein